MITYTDFKSIMLFIKKELEAKGTPIVLKRWRKKSPYQKARFKDEYVFAEVWCYRKDGGIGLVITGEEVENEKLADLIELVKVGLY